MENQGLIKERLKIISSVDENITAFSLYDGSRTTTITYRQFLNDIFKATGFFVRKDIKNHHIAIAAPTSYDWIVAFFAIVGSGNIAVLLNPDLPKEVLQQQCEQADVTIVCSNTPCMMEFCTNCGGVEYFSFEEIKAGMPISMKEIYSCAPDDTITMLFTSGTMGESKIAEISSKNIGTHMSDVEIVYKSNKAQKFLLCLPLFHIFALDCAIGCLQRKKTVCIGRGMRYVLSDLPVFNPDFVALVPAVLESMVKILDGAKTAEERQKCIGSNLSGIVLGGAGVKPDLCRYMINLGIKMNSLYGMTESTGSGLFCIWDEDNLGTIGRPYGETECRIVDGELLMRTPAIMNGYYKNPGETAKILEDGWLHTGDLAHCDENGYYYLIGRKKNVMILSNGENVNPEEIEAAFSECPEILESMVYNDAKGICADVYTKEKAACAAFIRKYNDSVPLYRQVYQVNYSAAPLEKTGTGKIKRKENAYV